MPPDQSPDARKMVSLLYELEPDGNFDAYQDRDGNEVGKKITKELRKMSRHINPPTK
jgi:hypothetical protein